MAANPNEPPYLNGLQEPPGGQWFVGLQSPLEPLPGGEPARRAGHSFHGFLRAWYVYLPHQLTTTRRLTRRMHTVVHYSKLGRGRG